MTIADLKTRITQKMGGTTVNKISDFNGLVYEAAQNLLLKIDPKETRRRTNFENAIYDDVYFYTSPTDLKKVIDIRPQANRNEGSDFVRRYSKAFDLKKATDTFAVEWNNGTQFLRLSKDITGDGEIVHEMDSITGNGTWAVGGDATNLTLDENDYLAGMGSLNFDVTATTSGYIENSTMDAVDLSDLENIGALFLWFYIPDTSRVTSLDLRWGSASGAYWNRTVTAPHDDSAFKTGWNSLRFDWNGATQTGSPDSAAIDYLRLTLAHTAEAETDFRVDNIIARVGQIFELCYYSNYLFRSSAGIWLEKPTANDESDIINLSTGSYNILLYEVMSIVPQENQGEDSQFNFDYFDRKLNGDGNQQGLYERYALQNPSEEILGQSEYYQFDSAPGLS